MKTVSEIKLISSLSILAITHVHNNNNKINSQNTRLILLFLKSKIINCIIELVTIT